MTTLESFGVSPDATSDTLLIDGLHLERTHILQKLNDVFPLLIDIDNGSQTARAVLFESGMSSNTLPEKFGDPWTVGRLQAVVEHCIKMSWPETGSG